MGNADKDAPLPVYFPGDLKHFKRTTTRNALLLRRKMTVLDAYVF